MPEFLLKISPVYENKMKPYLISTQALNSYSIKLVLKTGDRTLDLRCGINAKA
ncbi:hypothetical protein [Christiangramia aestuarii]|uniref:hypothetical protein n=1 Tax=Christiangramia aestuarii TaxID=1028746 RepID=UPI0012E193B2|nr:hypothetical protein [Christiangramia aestuarii]